jgi:L-lysine exporter family protein LysE/ArgO
MILFLSFLQGFLFSLSLCFDLGMVNVAIVKAGVERGFKSSFMIGFGSCFGDMAYLALALFGFSYILNIEAVKWALWIAGTIVLLYLSYKMVKESIRPKIIDWNGNGAIARKSSADFWFGLGAALSSPTVMLWFVASAGPIVAELNGDGQAVIAMFVAGFFVAGLLWSLVMAIVSSSTGKALGPTFIRILSLLSALLFLYFAFRVFISGLSNVTDG